MCTALLCKICEVTWEPISHKRNTDGMNKVEQPTSSFPTHITLHHRHGPMRFKSCFDVIYISSLCLSRAQDPPCLLWKPFIKPFEEVLSISFPQKWCVFILTCFFNDKIYAFSDRKLRPLWRWFLSQIYIKTLKLNCPVGFVLGVDKPCQWLHFFFFFFRKNTLWWWGE